MSRADNSFAFAFNKIAPPESNSPEALRAYNSKVNRAFEEIYEKVHGYLSLKNLDAATRKTINNKVGTDELHTLAEQTNEKFSWIVKSGTSASNVELTDRVLALNVANINANGVLTINGLNYDLAKMFANVDGQTVINGNWIKTGKIDADRINVDQLSVNKISSLDDPDLRAEFGEIGYRQDGLIFYNGLGNYPLSVGTERYGAGGYVRSAGFLVLQGDGSAWLTLQNGYVHSNTHLTPDEDGHGNASLGTRSPNLDRRWKNVNITGSVDNSSDRRVKRDIADLDSGDTLDRLRPRQFRMIADGEDGKTRWGFIAQEAKEALDAAGVSDVEFYHDDNPEHLSLCYTELVAVLVDGYQKQRSRIDALEKRLATLEGTHDDRR